MTVPKLVVVYNALLLVVLMVVCHAEAANLHLAWDPSPSQVTGYRLYYGKIKRGYDMVVDVGNQTSYTLSDLESGQRYYFSVTAYDSRGNESVFGNEVNVTPFSSHAGPPKAVMHTPLQLPAGARQATAAPLAFESRGEQRPREGKNGPRADGEGKASTPAARRSGGDSPQAAAHDSTGANASRVPLSLGSAS